MNRILVIEDEEMIRKQLTKLLERNNFEVGVAATIAEAVDCDPDSFDLILADIRLPGEPGTEILNRVAEVPVIMMTSHASVRSAVESMKLGAIDYISKPFDHDELLLVIQRSLRENRLSAQNAAMRHDLHRLFPHTEFSTRNASLKSKVDGLINLADHQKFVFLHGERGTGKELLARLTHESAERGKGPLVFADLPSYGSKELEAILMGGAKPTADSPTKTVSDQNTAPLYLGENQLKLPRLGLLHAAHTGTIILRNVVELPLATQRRLIDLVKPERSQFSENSKNAERAFDVRVIALNMESMEDSLANGQLDEEFASRFTDHVIAIPPLRERREDLESLAKHYLEQFLRRYRKRKISLSQHAIDALQSYHWPGNITELKSVIERAVLMVEAEEILPAHLGFNMLDDDVSIPLDLTLDGYFRYFVAHYQEQLSETELAGKLGISRKALWERRQKMSLPRKT